MTNPTVLADLPVPNLPLLRKVLDHIDAHPEEYQQAVFQRRTDCGTAYCIAGHAARMAGAQFTQDSVYVMTPEGVEVRIAEYAQDVLGITLNEAFCHMPESGFYGLFASDATRAEVQLAAEAIAARAGERL